MPIIHKWWDPSFRQPWSRLGMGVGENISIRSCESHGNPSTYVESRVLGQKITAGRPEETERGWSQLSYVMTIVRSYAFYEPCYILFSKYVFHLWKTNVVRPTQLICHARSNLCLCAFAKSFQNVCALKGLPYPWFMEQVQKIWKKFAFKPPT